MPVFRVFAVGLVTAVLSIVIGCGGSNPSESAADNIKRQQEAKLEAMKQLADALEKGDRQGVAGAAEGLVSNALDAKANPEAAKELIDVYNKRVKGKLKGETAVQVRGIVDGVENDLKK